MEVILQPGVPDCIVSLAGLLRPLLELHWTRGRRPVVEVLAKADYRRALIAKLTEEAAEVAGADETTYLEELADVLEVVRSLADEAGWSLDEVVSERSEGPRPRAVRRASVPRRRRGRRADRRAGEAVTADDVVGRGSEAAG